MPVHPSEEEAPTGLTEKIAKDPSSATESTASTHEGHVNEHDPQGKPRTQDFVNKGPQIPMRVEDLPPKASREEQEAKMRELNQ